MDEMERHSALIGDIYDAALAPAQWPQVLGQVRDFVKGCGASLFWKDAVSKGGGVNYMDAGGGIDPRYIQLWEDKYAKLDPGTTVQFFGEVGKPFTTIDYLMYEEFLETRYYKEWVRPQRLVDSISTVLDKSGMNYSAVVVFRHERDGLADAAACGRAALIAPHLRRAVVIGRLLDARTAEAATLADTLDGLSASLLLVDQRGRIVHANARGHLMLTEGVPLRAPGAKLTCDHADADRALHDVFLAASSGDAAVGTRGVAVPLTARDGERYVAHVLPLTSGARRRAGTTYAAVAAVFVHKAALDTPSPPEVIARTFKLTPSELRVLLAIVEVGGVPEVAEALGVAETTVKFHLRRLFEKTGTHRQADLVKLVAGFSSPIIG
jgi:DNA-binding CsgD family transcriptional regulator